jgi:protocatechuate 4,5-dioxygenase alpha subunit
LEVVDGRLRSDHAGMTHPTDELLEGYGTLIFDARQSRKGYALNMCCIALCDRTARERFKADPETFVSGYALTADQKSALLGRDFNRMLELGGNIYYLSKVAAMDGKSFQQLASEMTGIPDQEFKDIMLAGGRPFDTELRRKHDLGACHG